MTLRDTFGMAAGNLRRMKLRAGLTTAGVVIAIGAFVSMLSFGAGNHRLITSQVESLGLLNTVPVYPGEAADSLPAAILDDAAVARFQTLSGVRLAYPLDPLKLRVAMTGGDTLTLEAQALTPAARETKLFSNFRAGGPPTPGGREILVTENFLRRFDLSTTEADSLIGDSLFVSLTVASFDSALTRALAPGQDYFREFMARLSPDSLKNPGFRRRIMHREISGAMSRFMGGYLHGQVLRDTLVVSGVLSLHGRGQVSVKPMLLDPELAARFHAAGSPAEPLALMTALERGELLPLGEGAAGEGYPQVTLDLEPLAAIDAVRDSLAAWGYRSFSFAEQLAEIRRVFLFFQLGLAAVGLVALATAALGIVNTMLMSISERRREIGVLKALGADEREIRGLFLTESALIGALGSALGILLGWLVARIASLVARAIMAKEGVPEMELFLTPLWLVAGAFLFGILISLLAGAAPAARAARVDPVTALRGE
jgi:putative ABC transport system permease protein